MRINRTSEKLKSRDRFAIFKLSVAVSKSVSIGGREHRFVVAQVPTARDGRSIPNCERRRILGRRYICRGCRER
ncbi:hypothetical protein DBV15_00607 [Temnothorax longispinosus]|uniref:Uncharacterized protein n=1 Tax=Temnothorax longispinosus TaxID=300112 RepID=A0A4S2KT18_9HYME|nr:hypothetical protein DBV15_00607 [Temnothorax longispinosus]